MKAKSERKGGDKEENAGKGDILGISSVMCVARVSQRQKIRVNGQNPVEVLRKQIAIKVPFCLPPVLEKVVCDKRSAVKYPF